MKTSRLLAGVLVFAFAVGVAYWYKQSGTPLAGLFGVDYQQHFRPAAEALLHHHSPYAVRGFYNGWWILPVFFPTLLLPPALGLSVYFAAGLFVYAFTAASLTAAFEKQKRTLWFRACMYLFLALGVIDCLYGNIDSLFVAAMAFTLPTSWALLFVLAKPQIGGIIFVFLTYRELSRDSSIKMRLQKIKRLALPSIVMFASSYLVYGNWMSGSSSLISAQWNTSLWPWSIPAGAFFLYGAFKGKDYRFVLMALPFITPYISSHTYLFAPLGAMTLQIDDWAWLPPVKRHLAAIDKDAETVV